MFEEAITDSGAVTGDIFWIGLTRPSTTESDLANMAWTSGDTPDLNLLSGTLSNSGL